MDDASTVNKFGCLLNASNSDSVLQCEKAMLQDAKTALHSISGSTMGKVEPFFGTIQLSSERGD